MQIDEGNFNAQLEDHLRRNATVERDATTDKSKGGQSQRFKPISIYGNDITAEEPTSFFHYRVRSGAAAVAPAEVDSSGIILGECPRQVFRGRVNELLRKCLFTVPF